MQTHVSFSKCTLNPSTVRSPLRACYRLNQLNHALAGGCLQLSEDKMCISLGFSSGQTSHSVQCINGGNIETAQQPVGKRSSDPLTRMTHHMSGQFLRWVVWFTALCASKRFVCMILKMDPMGISRAKALATAFAFEFLLLERRKGLQMIRRVQVKCSKR